jgi:hypothetical protein
LRVESQRALIELYNVFIDRLAVAGRVRHGRGTHCDIVSVGIVWPLSHRTQGFRLDQFDAERIGETGDEFDLQLAELAPVAVKAVGPDMRAGLGRNELGVDLHLLAKAAHASFEHIAHAKLAADLFGVDRLALVGERRPARDDEAVLQVRKVGGQIVGDPVGEIVLLLVAGEVLERQHDDREPWRVGELIVNRSRHETRRVAGAPRKSPRRKKQERQRSSKRRPARPDSMRPCRRLGRFLPRRRALAQQISAHRLGDVLEVLSP